MSASSLVLSLIFVSLRLISFHTLPNWTLPVAKATCLFVKVIVMLKQCHQDSVSTFLYACFFSAHSSGLKQLQVCILLIPQCGKGEMIFPVVPTEVSELNLTKISLVGTHAVVDAFCAPPRSLLSAAAPLPSFLFSPPTSVSRLWLAV